jgi:3-hydroxyisobutyrate dehydrogenase
MNKKGNDYIVDNRYETEDEIQVKIWCMLEDAVLNRKSDFRTPIFISSNNDEPDGRVVVLRGADQNQCSLSFHSDYRSNKVNLLKQNPKGALVFYDKKEKIQLRIKVDCTINFKNNISKNAWKKTQQISRKCYLASLAPGTKMEKPGSSIDEKFEAFEYSFEESEMGEDNFCVVTCKIITIEWLYLSVKGHRRAKIYFDKQENHFNWLVP